MPVLRLCARHRTLSPGRCPICADERKARGRIHTDRANRGFRRAILERDGYVCRWCGNFGDTLDYVRALVDGGNPFDETNGVCACRSCNSRRGGRFQTGGISGAESLWAGILHGRGGRRPHDVLPWMVCGAEGGGRVRIKGNDAQTDTMPLRCEKNCSQKQKRIGND